MKKEFATKAQRKNPPPSRSVTPPPAEDTPLPRGMKKKFGMGIVLNSSGGVYSIKQVIESLRNSDIILNF